MKVSHLLREQRQILPRRDPVQEGTTEKKEKSKPCVYTCTCNWQLCGPDITIAFVFALFYNLPQFFKESQEDSWYSII